jgi:hypothetical protein
MVNHTDADGELTFEQACRMPPGMVSKRLSKPYRPDRALAMIRAREADLLGAPQERYQQLSGQRGPPFATCGPTRSPDNILAAVLKVKLPTPSHKCRLVGRRFRYHCGRLIALPD